MHRTLLVVAALVHFSSSGAPVLDNTLKPAAGLNLGTGPDYQLSQFQGKLGPRGRNLYFSFLKFDIARNESVAFDGPPGVRNVLVRVTGREPSVIDGRLQVLIPSADFFLMNPNGVSFGRHAKVEPAGSFVVTTAQELRFKDGAAFAVATPPQALLSTRAPAAFGFLAPRPANIRVGGPAVAAGIRVPDGRTASLVGGDVRVAGGAPIAAPAGRVNVVSLAGPGEVRLSTDPTSRTQIDAGVLRGAVAIADQSTLAADDGGVVVVRARDLTLSAGAAISGRTMDAAGRKGIDVGLTGALRMSGRAEIRGGTLGSGDGAPIRISADSVSLKDFLTTIAADVGVLNDEFASDLATGAGGSITVHAGDVRIEDAASISALSIGAGAGASVAIVARRGMFVRGVDRGDLRGKAEDALPLTGVVAETRAEAGHAAGPGGGITIDTPVLEMYRGSELNTTTLTPQRAGDITVRAGRVLFDGRDRIILTGMQSRAGIRGTGQGGSIIVIADSVTLRDGGTISASTFGRGPGGSVDLTARRELLLSGPGEAFSGLFARSTRTDPRGGAGGDVNVTAGRARVEDGSLVSATTLGDGRGGVVRINADSLTLDAARIESASLGAGRAGDVFVRGRDRVRLSNGATISAKADLSAGGNVSVLGGRTVLVEQSQITASAAGQGAQISIDPRRVALNASVINGRALDQDVRVVINRNSAFFQSVDSVINSNAVTAPVDVDLSGVLAQLPSAALAVDVTIRSACPIGLPAGISSFLIVGRGATAAEPGGFTPDTARGERSTPAPRAPAPPPPARPPG